MAGVFNCSRELFGGAITGVLPESLQDISQVREVPDNQEVFSDQDSDRSVIVEILEYEKGQSNENAARYFFEDLAQANESVENKVEHVELDVALEGLGLKEGVFVSVLVGTQRVAKFHEKALNTVRVFLCTVRLAKQETDILIMLNAPIQIDPSSSSAESVLAAAKFSLSTD
eukprot:CAMPEP_0203757484 /NCGR_PEP_ID=MMETSP0098-20131031/10521_1 /ASSEMBLY_ACC=CAM_ASM_000208 /TAXON_ID=96639 /ORGANISM=" , Strain NY0313808BC1" /LENGTH=171 /DNA_ID=CAMNT_0050649701 /DNA_START=1011 /DNA_END=1523 /DNA_ORIENTATION=+